MTTIEDLPTISAASNQPDEHLDLTSDANEEEPDVDWQTAVNTCLGDLERECHRTAVALENPESEDNRPIMTHGAKAIATLESISQILHDNDVDVACILDDTRQELLHAYVEAQADRSSIAKVLLRGVFEGLFMALLYRQQKMSLRTWAQGAQFDMAHQLFDDKHQFYIYYKMLFGDERYKQHYGNNAPSYKQIIEEAVSLYKTLSGSVHKKRVRSEENFTTLVERLFRIALSFLEREEDLPSDLGFPTPLTFPQLRADARRR